ncbi:MAG: sulfotransferase domain-containing protein [Rhodospirillales bacterium]|jgi:hypothetical protein|nr:sulfotransferase domain-containing protein [Rhodospirillales bacterium]
MGKLLWIASFPKSGNTWIRAFLANYLTDSETPIDINTLPNFALGDMRSEAYERVAGRPASELTADEIDRLRPAVHRAIADAQPGVVFVKTHSILATAGGTPLITPEVTFAAIYIVRNPLDVAVSFADHYGLSPAEGARAVCFPGLAIDPRAGQVKQHLSDWSSHVRSWLAAEGLKRHVVRYEDLLMAPLPHFSDVIEFLGLAPNRDRIGRAVRNASFRALARQERERGFRERSRHSRRFFRSGVVGGWRKCLPPQDVDLILRSHGPTMRELGYVAADGQLTV